jgi:hypothetical protein
MSAEKKIIKGRVGLLKLAEELGNVSQACKVLGYSRDTFYRYKELFETGGELALQDLSRRKPLEANRVEPHIDEAVVAFATQQPAYGQQRVSSELKKRAIFISPGGVRSIWLRHELETFKKRLKALEARAAQDNLVLTEAQLKALEKSRMEQEAHGEIETEHPGYLIAQDTYYVSNMKALVAFTNKPLLTPTAGWPLLSCMTARTPWWRPICSTIRCYPGSRARRCAC